VTSLAAHFGPPDEHDRLPYHPQCPRCREERLEGALSGRPLASHQAQAAITAGVLAFTSVTPATAFATGTHGEVEGTVAPGQVTPDVESETGFDRSSDAETPLDDQALAPADDSKGVDAAAAAGTAPSTTAPTTDAPVLGPDRQPTSDAPPADTEEPAPQPAESAATAPAATEEPAAPATPTNHALAANEKAIKRVKRVHRRAVEKSRVVRAKVVAAPAVAAVPPAAPAPARAKVSATRVAAVAQAPARPSRPARPGDESHVVQSGESLWSIAADLLGDDASPARIAREVNRLWEANRDRIGTGNRDLVMAGTRLEL
jgi:hypothetical protein